VTSGDGVLNRVVVADADAMRRLAADVAKRCRAGDVVVLSGPLGAGKTTFTQGLATGLGVAGPVTSPTFVIARVHRSTVGGPDLVHVDAYRLGGLAELEDLDLDASLAESVTVVEWGEGLAETLSTEVVRVQIERDTDPRTPGAPVSDERQVTLIWPPGRRG
jgi:tRNA threonylcarbamoyladenosine biosynthesis protein TsaE